MSTSHERRLSTQKSIATSHRFSPSLRRLQVFLRRRSHSRRRSSSASALPAASSAPAVIGKGHFDPPPTTTPTPSPSPSPTKQSPKRANVTRKPSYRFGFFKRQTGKNQHHASVVAPENRAGSRTSLSRKNAISRGSSGSVDGKVGAAPTTTTTTTTATTTAEVVAVAVGAASEKSIPRAKSLQEKVDAPPAPQDRSLEPQTFIPGGYLHNLTPPEPAHRSPLTVAQSATVQDSDHLSPSPVTMHPIPLTSELQLPHVARPSIVPPQHTVRQDSPFPLYHTTSRSVKHVHVPRSRPQLSSSGLPSSSISDLPSQSNPPHKPSSLARGIDRRNTLANIQPVMSQSVALPPIPPTLKGSRASSMHEQGSGQSLNEVKHQRRMSAGEPTASTHPETYKPQLSGGQSHTASKRSSLYFRPDPSATGQQSWLSRHESTAPPVSDAERKRQESIFELIETEKNFLLDLQLMHISFINPRGNAYVEVFWNLEEIMLATRDFVKCLMERQSKDGHVVRRISDILLEKVEQFKCFALFCSKTTQAIKRVNQLKMVDTEFQELLKTFTERSSVKLGLESYLLKPTQRVTRYPLLIQAIVARTTDPQEKKDLQKAHSEFSKLCSFVNKKCGDEDLRCDLLDSYDECRQKFTKYPIDGKPIKLFKNVKVQGEPVNMLMSSKHLILYREKGNRKELIKLLPHRHVLYHHHVHHSFDAAGGALVVVPNVKAGATKSKANTVLMIFPQGDFATANTIARYMAVVEGEPTNEGFVRIYDFHLDTAKKVDKTANRLSNNPPPSQGSTLLPAAPRLRTRSLANEAKESARNLAGKVDMSARKLNTMKIHDIDLDIVDIARPSFTFRDEIDELVKQRPTVTVSQSIMLEYGHVKGESPCYRIVSIKNRHKLKISVKRWERMPAWKCSTPIDSDIILLGSEDGMFALSTVGSELFCHHQKQFSKNIMDIQLIQNQETRWCITLEGKDERLKISRIDALKKSIMERKSLVNMTSSGFGFIRDVPQSTGTKAFKYFSVGDQGFLAKVSLEAKLPPLSTLIHYMGESKQTRQQSRQESFVLQDVAQTYVIFSLYEYIEGSHSVFSALQTVACPITALGNPTLVSRALLEQLFPRQTFLTVYRQTSTLCFTAGQSFLILDLSNSFQGIFDYKALKQVIFPVVPETSHALGIGEIEGGKMLLVYEDYGVEITWPELLSVSKRRTVPSQEASDNAELSVEALSGEAAKITRWERPVDSCAFIEGRVFLYRRTGVEVWPTGEVLILPGCQVLNKDKGWIASPPMAEANIVLQRQDLKMEEMVGTVQDKVSNESAAQVAAHRQVLYRLQFIE